MEQKLYMFRHSESFDNAGKIFSGRRNVDLTPKGEENAMKIAEYLRDKNIDVAYTSPMRRTRECLYIALKYQPKIEIVEDERLVERSYGWLEGHSKKWWAKHIFWLFKIFHRSYYIPPPGGESIRHVKKRVDGFLKELLQIIRKERVNVAIAGHSNSLRPIRQYFEHLSNREMTKIEIAPGQVFEYTLEI